jgi:hypothetical protein
MPLAPQVSVAIESVRRRGAKAWQVTWRIRNEGPSAFTVREAWHPHARFRSSRLSRSLRVNAGAEASLEVPARVDAAPGDEIEIGFLILRVRRGREEWRVLTRFSVRLDDDGMPRPRVAAVDVHRAED